MNARITTDPTLPTPSWSIPRGGPYAPVDLLRRFETPDGIGRTLTMGQYQMVEDAIEASGVSEWLPTTADGKKRSVCGGYVIAPVCT